MKTTLPNLRLVRQLLAATAAGLLFVTSQARAQSILFITDGDWVRRYDVSNTTMNPIFVHLQSATGVALDASGNLYVGTTGGLPNSGPGVMAYNGTTNEQIGTDPFVNYYGTPGGDPRDVIGPAGMRFSTSGNLAIADTLLNNVHIYNGTGTSLGNFTGPSVNQPTDVAFDFSGNLYAAGGGGISVSVGGFQAFTDFISPGTAGMANPVALTFGPDGKLYVADNNTDKILRFNADGSFDQLFANLDVLVSGVFIPSSLAFGSGYNLYVAGQNIGEADGQVLLFQNGVYNGAMVTGLVSPNSIAFVPEPAAWWLSLGAGLMLIAKRRRMMRSS